MKPQKIILLILIILNSMDVFSQDQNIKNIKALRKDSIIGIANNILKKKHSTLKINSNDFIITAWSNKKGVFVKFKRIFKYIPLDKPENDYKHHDLFINIIEKNVSPIDNTGINLFYIPTDEERKKIEFLKENVEFDPAYDATVYERENSYQMYFDNESFSGTCNIDKITGESACMSGVNSSPIKVDPEVDPLIEITE